MTLGEKIVIQRKELNYTQEQLADILGVSRQSISKWESEVSHILKLTNSLNLEKSSIVQWIIY